MVRANNFTTSPDAVKTPHRITELCEEEIRTKRSYRKRRIVATSSPKTENTKLATPIKKNGARSKPLKTSNGLTNMTNGHTMRSRAARTAARAADSHKLTEYFKEEPKSPVSSCSSPPPISIKTETVKLESKVNGSCSRKLTEYFPVRRSVRKTSSCIMAEKMRDFERAVREQREEGLAIAYFGDKGRGVIATQPFERGQFVVEYAGDLISRAEAKKREVEYAQNPEVGCYMFYFEHNEKRYCIDATAESGRLGRLVNHSRNGNLKKMTVWVDGPRVVLQAAHDIAPGTELSYDYGDRSKESLKHYPWLAL